MDAWLPEGHEDCPLPDCDGYLRNTPTWGTSECSECERVFIEDTAYFYSGPQHPEHINSNVRG